MRKYLLYILFGTILTPAFSQHNYYNTISKTTIKGTSNIHRWKSIANKAKISMVMTIDSGKLKAIQYVAVEVPVKEIKSSEGEAMDNNTYSVLKIDKYPAIVFRLEKVSNIVKIGEIYVISAAGTLAVAGVVNKIELKVVGRVNNNGSVSFSFSKDIKMSDYQLILPTVLFGMIKTRDEIEVKFNFIVKPT